MNSHIEGYIGLVIIVLSMLPFVLAGLYPEKVPFLVKYYEENDN